jgi:hypothetical protein
MMPLYHALDQRSDGGPCRPEVRRARCRAEFVATFGASLLMRETMIARCLVSLVSVAAACATWTGLPGDAATVRDTQVAERSVYARRLRDTPAVRELDRAYAELEVAMRPHGCARCHAPANPASDHAARETHAWALLESRRAIVAMLEANLMPPATRERPAGIEDPVARSALIQSARTFLRVADAAIGAD